MINRAPSLEEANQAIERQGKKVRKRTYAEMKDALRGAKLLGDVGGRTRHREQFLDAIENQNLESSKKIAAFNAANLSADTYIK